MSTRIQIYVSVEIYDQNDGGSRLNHSTACQPVDLPLNAADAIDVNTLTGALIEEALSEYEVKTEQQQVENKPE